ncbi:MAG: hypothetical protein R3C58_09840 [Parvularculaceae bacterium]
MIGLMIANIATASIAIFALRGIYFALLEDCGVPAAMTGTATGDYLCHRVHARRVHAAGRGALLDAFPGELGYRYFFGFITALCVCGGIVMHLLQRMGRASPSAGPSTPSSPHCARRAGDAAARMRAGIAKIKSADQRLVLRPLGRRPHERADPSAGRRGKCSLR